MDIPHPVSGRVGGNRELLDFQLNRARAGIDLASLTENLIVTKESPIDEVVEMLDIIQEIGYKSPLVNQD
jgi:hypothetical protein